MSEIVSSATADPIPAFTGQVPGIKDDPTGPLFPAARSPRGQDRDGFRREAMTTSAVEKRIGRYVAAFGLDPNVTAHSLRVTALTTARERGSDIIDLQDFVGHADPRTTLTDIRGRDRLSKSLAYVLKYDPHRRRYPRRRCA